MRLSLLVCACLAGVSPVAGQSTGDPIVPGEELEIYVMTMGRGDAVWAKFGHNAIGIRDRRLGTDIVYNWGVFSFSESDFLIRLLEGEMRYWVASEPVEQTLAEYEYFNRSVSVQELTLTPAQRLELKRAIEFNALPENKFYHYDYFLDNCSTRVRDMLDRLLGGALRRQFGTTGSGRSFRDEARRLTEDSPWTYTGIDIGLASPTDREMSRWEQMFLPGGVQQGLREVLVAGENGDSVPLVSSERVLLSATRPDAPAAPGNLVVRYLLIGGATAALIILLSQTRAVSAARALAVTWSVAAGFLGLLLVLLWAATSHIWTYRNVNVLLFNPLWFLLIPAAARLGNAPAAWVRRVTQLLGFGLLGALCVALLGTPQRVEQVTALVVPVSGAVLWLILRGAAVSRTA